MHRERGVLNEVLAPLVLGLVLAGIGTLAGYAYGTTTANNKAKLHLKEMETQWNAQIETLRDAAAVRQRDYSTKIGELNGTIQTQADAHKVALAAIADQHAARMRNSENRAAAYHRMSESGAAESAALAAHTAELDRTVEEGRRLVAELRETLGQRDSEITQLGVALKALHQLTTSGKEQ